MNTFGVIIQHADGSHQMETWIVTDMSETQLLNRIRAFDNPYPTMPQNGNYGFTS